MSANAALKPQTPASSPATATALIAAALPGFETLLQEAIAAVRQKVLVVLARDLCHGAARA
jgi:(2S)-methylsuccinyl-CoA dehydrogenase